MLRLNICIVMFTILIPRFNGPWPRLYVTYETPACAETQPAVINSFTLTPNVEACSSQSTMQYVRLVVDYVTVHAVNRRLLTAVAIRRP
jgi:hypothetical protein